MLVKAWPSRRRTQQKNWARRMEPSRVVYEEGGGIGCEIEIQLHLPLASGEGRTVEAISMAERVFQQVGGNGQGLHAAGDVAELEVDDANVALDDARKGIRDQILAVLGLQRPKLETGHLQAPRTKRHRQVGRRNDIC
ncbi:MAG: hypothetical protein QM692_03015 [Thermomicrobiales bacterium]